MNAYIKHIEQQFQPGMSWERHGKDLHIDHIKPCAAFDLTDPEQQKICFHFSNMRPLWAVDNLKKGAKFDQDQEKNNLFDTGADSPQHSMDSNIPKPPKEKKSKQCAEGRFVPKHIEKKIISDIAALLKKGEVELQNQLERK